MKGGADGWNVRKELECFLLRVVEAASDLDKGLVLHLFQLADEPRLWFVGVEPELRAVGDGWDDYRFVEKA